MKKSQAKKHIRKVHTQAATLQEQLAAVVAEPQAPANVAPFRACIMVTGGSLKAPVKSDLALIPSVQADEISRYGTDAKRVQQGLAANLLAGTPFSREVMTKTAPCWSERSVRNDKAAFFGLLDLTATGKMTLEMLRSSWTLTLKERKRYDAPTIRSLFVAAKEYLRLSGAVEARVSPMARFARAILEIIDNRTLSTDERIRLVRTKMEEKAEWPEVVQPAAAQAAGPAELAPIAEAIRRQGRQAA